MTGWHIFSFMLGSLSTLVWLGRPSKDEDPDDWDDMITKEYD